MEYIFNQMLLKVYYMKFKKSQMTIRDISKPSSAKYNFLLVKKIISI